MAKLWDKIKKGKLVTSFRSLKTRIFCIIMAAGIVPCIVLHFGILERYLDNTIATRTTEVQTQVRIIADHLITYNYMLDSSNDVVNAELLQLSNLYDGRVLIIDGGLRIIKDTYAVRGGKTLISEAIIKCLKGEGASNSLKEAGYIEIIVPIEEKFENQSRVVGAMLTSVSTDSIINGYEYIQSRAFLLEIVAMVVIFGFALLLSRKMLKPFEKITDAINDVKNGFTDEEISVTDYIETEHIGDAFNQMMGRMKVLDDSRQEFVSNVSHELKTPITSIKVLADSLRGQEDVPVELYREFMEDIATEIDRENKIINDLLALTKMDRAASDLNISQVDVNMLVELIMRRLRPIAIKRDIELIYESIRPVTAAIDEVKITLVITNLIENAIKYNKEHGWVKVTVDADHQFFTVEVADSGIGIPEDCAEHIYERFYRVDKSHSREIEGTGLGLSITRSAVLMHRGTIKVVSEEGEGTTFTVKIPLTYIAVS